MHGGKKLLQIVSAAALLRHPIERRTQRLHSLAIGNIVVAGVEARHLSIQQKGRAGHGNIQQSSVFLSALRFEGDALAFRQGFGHPLRLRQPVRRHHQIFQGLPDHFGRFIFEHAHEGFIGQQHAMAAIRDAQPVGRCLKHLFQKLQAALGALLILSARFEERRDRAGMFRARPRSGRGGVSRLNIFRQGVFRPYKCRRSSAFQRLLEPAGGY